MERTIARFRRLAEAHFGGRPSPGNRYPEALRALAVEVASGRAVISRTLGEFARRGWVALHRGEIEILKPEALKRAAD